MAVLVFIAMKVKKCTSQISKMVLVISRAVLRKIAAIGGVGRDDKTRQRHVTALDLRSHGAKILQLVLYLPYFSYMDFSSNCFSRHRFLNSLIF